MLIIATWTVKAAAQTPATNPAPAFDLAAGPALLARVQDQTFNFDEPAFYWLVQRVARHDPAAVFELTPRETPTPWRHLLERPAEFRGRLIVVEGLVSRTDAYHIQSPIAGEIGPVTQADLSAFDARGLCTVICAAGGEPLPLRTHVRAKGYFLKVRQYETAGGKVAFAPLIVANHLETVAPAGSASDLRLSGEGMWSSQNLIIFGTAALAVVWFVLRRSTRRAVSHRNVGRSARSIQRDEPAADDFNWLLDESNDRRP